MRRVCFLVVVVVSACVCACGSEPVIDLTPPGLTPTEGEGEGEGENGPQGSCDPIKNASFGAAITLQVPRSRHAAARLSDGRVMLIGGEDDSFLPIAHVEIIDPVAGTSVAGPPLNSARYTHAAVVLADGSVVVAGGFGDGHLDSVERFDGTSWTTLAPLDHARAGISGVALNDGRALFFGGDNTTAIPTTAVTVDATGAVQSANVDIGANRRLHSAMVLNDGTVFIAGGFFTSAIATTTFVAADATSAVPGPQLPGARRQATGVALPDGAALIVGGIGTGAVLSDIQRLAPSRAGYVSNGNLKQKRHSAPAVALGCGAVVCGGLDDVALATCEGIDDAGLPIAMNAVLPQATFSFTFTTLSSTSALVAGGTLPDGHVGEARVLTLAE